jgi:uncharacterized membrane protein YqiK
VSKFVDRMVGRNPPERHAEIEESAGAPDAEGSSGSPTMSRLAEYTAHETRVNEWSPDTAPLTVEAHEEVDFSMDYGKLGEHVTSVLEAANKAAAKIREEARTAAERVAERSNSEALGVLEKAHAQAEQVSRESERLRAEAEKQSRETTRDADAYAAEKRREAEAEATGILSRARREAREHTRAAHERHSALAKDVALSEERLRQLVGGLRNLAGTLEELVPERAKSDTANVEDEDTSLEESLRPSVAAQEPAEPQA